MQLSAQDNGTFAGAPLTSNVKLKFASGGAGYVVSREGAEAVAKCETEMDTFPQTWEFMYGEDRVVAICLWRSGVVLDDALSASFFHNLRLARYYVLPIEERSKLTVDWIASMRFPISVHPLKTPKLLRRAYQAMRHRQAGVCETNRALTEWVSK